MSRIPSPLRRAFRARSARSAAVCCDQGPPDDHAARISGDLSCELPEEDLAEDLSESLDLYVAGSKPRCEEAEYLQLVEDAVDRIARGR